MFPHDVVSIQRYQFRLSQVHLCSRVSKQNISRVLSLVWHINGGQQKDFSYGFSTRKTSATSSYPWYDWYALLVRHLRVVRLAPGQTAPTFLMAELYSAAGLSSYHLDVVLLTTDISASRNVSGVFHLPVKNNVSRSSLHPFTVPKVKR